MEKYDVVVVGGSAAGIPAAITSRIQCSDKSVLLIRKEKKVQIPCGIPYIFGTFGDPEKNIIPDEVLSKNGIDLLVDEVNLIDREEKRVNTSGGRNISYEKLVLATGSKPIELPIPGADKKNVFYPKKDLNYLENMLKSFEKSTNVVIIGGGFIGVEFAGEMQKKGNNVTLIEILPHCLMRVLDEELCKEAEEKISDMGVKIITCSKIVEIIGKESVSSVRLSDGSEIETEMLLIGVGVKPDISLAKKIGLEVNDSGILVDDKMRTSDENIFACGDCAAKKSFFTGKPSDSRLASVATSEARVAGSNLFGSRRTNPGVVGVFSTVVGDMVLGNAGLTEKSAKENGFEIVSGESESPDRHPGCMPSMSEMKVKLLFNSNNKELIGGHIRGGLSAGEFINIISTCIQERMTAEKIATLQIGTHPAVTSSPIAYQMVNAAELAIRKMAESE